MSRIDAIKREIELLSPEELSELRQWLAAYDADQWDRQIETDAAAGNLRKLAKRVLRHHRAGRTRPL